MREARHGDWTLLTQWGHRYGGVVVRHFVMLVCIDRIYVCVGRLRLTCNCVFI